ncbi:MAG: hypothetical protein UV06_C0012G0008 [Candidatus Collierbacteria bacterium GW2011_GWA2_42_17]|uniref:Uncharacterized protein n=1 Tax=Candidatus Collierbacteria bacterium GW2011_GWA2_42_17 TaxID=1618378 RepID=A0A0G0Z0Y0_9BACT|nr:MAG: hypothetical protein UV06_C0012G0008 [Candidatus Collierbacteria bacterium GW2011_GWA2_42_17]HBX64510.1 hypothetical protein [Candidatus Collierbacteria bacterium]HCW31188.1 hypothetical protein [Candidatus Collierbacteria bacterium]
MAEIITPQTEVQLAETITPQIEIQPPLFAPDGSPSDEVKKALKQMEIEQNRRWAEEIADLIEERHQNHAP